ncbi:MAG: hypothetical protein PVJ43_05615 [Gemmatimonadales bacterium]|jgi:hypothetical protein
MKVPDDIYERLAREIESDESPVGIDAKHTHVIILHMLMEMERRLERIEEAVGLDRPDA